MDWRDSALCREIGSEIFFPEPSDWWSNAQAKKVCAQCPVQAECLSAGMTEEYGIWGGLSSTERRRLRNRAVA